MRPDGGGGVGWARLGGGGGAEGRGRVEREGEGDGEGAGGRGCVEGEGGRGVGWERGWVGGQEVAEKEGGGQECQDLIFPSTPSYDVLEAWMIMKQEKARWLT